MPAYDVTFSLWYVRNASLCPGSTAYNSVTWGTSGVPTSTCEKRGLTGVIFAVTTC